MRFDKNDYSVPARCVRQTLLVRATPETIRIFSDTELVASHPRSYRRAALIQDREHLEEVWQYKHKAKDDAGHSYLTSRVPLAEQLLEHYCQAGKCVARKRAELLALLHSYGPQCLQEAITLALMQPTPGSLSVPREAVAVLVDGSSTPEVSGFDRVAIMAFVRVTEQVKPMRQSAGEPRERIYRP